MEQTLRVPLGVGEIVSDSLRELRAHVGTYLVVALPFCALDLLLREAAGSSLDAARGALGSDPSAVALDDVGGAIAAAAGGISLHLCALATTTMLAAACVQLAARAWAGAPLVIGEALRGGMRRAPAVVLTGLLFALLLTAVEMPALIGAVVLVALQSAALAWIGGSIVVVYAIAAFVVVTLRYGMFTQACVLEGQRGLSALSRSVDLVASRGERFWRGPKLRLSVVFLLSMALSFALQGLFALPRYLMAGAIGWDVADAGLPPLTALPLWFGVPFALVEVATNAVLYPFTSILLTLFYFDLRVRTEGIDVVPAATPAGAR